VKKIAFITGFMGILTVLILVFGLGYRKAQIKRIDFYTMQVSRQIASGLDDESLIRQLFMFYFQLDDYKTLEKLMPGGIFIHTNNIPLKNTGRQDLGLLDLNIEKINEIYRKKGLPSPVFSVDEEGGGVNRINNEALDFPSPMTIGEAFSKSHQDDLPMLAGFYTCIGLRRHGIQWPLVPVADVQSNPDNPVIGIRSFGSDPKMVTHMVSQYILGVQNGRCLSAMKHFPGHGDTNLDSHFDLPSIDKNLEELKKTELYPYEHLLGNDKSPDGIMSAHIIFNKISPEPATMSHKWLTQILKNELHFKGIIVTDDLTMNAVNIYASKEKIKNTAVKAFLAGADVLLYAFAVNESEQMLNGFVAAYKRGEIPKERILESVQKIIYRKIRLGILDQYIREHKNQWPLETRQMATQLLEYSKETDLNIQNLQSQLAKIESVNNFISKNGIKTIWGNPDTAINIQSYPLFTDYPETGKYYQRMKDKTQVYPLQKLASTACPDKCVVLNTLKMPLEKILALKKKNRWILFTINNPFPKKKFTAFLSDEDVIVDTFSITETSRDKLIETWLENKIPPKAAVLY